MAFGDTVKVHLTYTEIMTMLYPDYVFTRNFLIRQLQEMQKEKEKANNDLDV